MTGAKSSLRKLGKRVNGRLGCWWYGGRRESIQLGGSHSVCLFCCYCCVCVGIVNVCEEGRKKRSEGRVGEELDYQVGAAAGDRQADEREEGVTHSDPNRANASHEAW